MARQNYGFSKRQRELAKKQKREEKLQRRQERKAAGGLDAAESVPGEGGEAGAVDAADDSAAEETEAIAIRIEPAP